MSFSPTSPVIGATVTGLTSPTYTLVEDTPPNSHSQQWAVSALGGTQSGVEVHSVSSPFTITWERPAQFRSLGVVNPVTGRLGAVPRNVYKIRCRKGVEPLSGQAFVNAQAELSISVPAGADVADPESVRAMLSAFFGFLATGTMTGSSLELADSTIDGILS